MKVNTKPVSKAHNFFYIYIMIFIPDTIVYFVQKQKKYSTGLLAQIFGNLDFKLV
jgi:hypothetical protein